MPALLCIGAGHVGLPLSLKFWQAGHTVHVVDIDEKKIAALREGTMPFLEDGCAQILEPAARDQRFTPVLYRDDIFAEITSQADFVVMTLGTPLGGDYTFRFDQYFDVLDRIVPHLRPGVTLVVRSTVAPLFTRNVVTARIASQRDWVPGVDFFPTFCPERLMQGTALSDIDDLPELIGADDEESAARARSLFETVHDGKRCITLSTVEAELAKLFLNTFRYTMFGLANEYALAAEQYGANIFNILAAANDGYPRGGIPRPGPSRGPCLGKDTAALAFSSPGGLISHAALKTNENLVLHVVNDLRAELKTLAHRRITVLGEAFKADTDDVRDNLTRPLVNLLVREGANVQIYDPLVPGRDDRTVLRGSDAVIVMTAHTAFKHWTEVDLARACERARNQVFVFDLWNIWSWADRVFGRGTDDSNENTDHGCGGFPYASGDAATPGTRT